jgi:hypothetical protein
MLPLGDTTGLVSPIGGLDGVVEGRNEVIEREPGTFPASPARLSQTVVVRPATSATGLGNELRRAPSPDPDF